MIKEDLAYLSIDEQLAHFASGRLRPREVLEAQLERVDALDASIRAVTDRFDSAALAQADEAEQRWRNGVARPLEGVTVAVKEEQAIAGEPLLLGSTARARRDSVSTIDHPVVQRLRAAGAIMHVRTTTPEYSAAGFSRSRLWGETVSPWHAGLSAGGSSGGSGAALAAGFASAATGSDVAGSLRIPASACGVVGFKPPFGSVPALPTESFDSYCHDGAMGRSVRDTLRLHDVLIGQHPDDFISLADPPALSGCLSASGLDGIRVGLARRMGDAPQSALSDQGIMAAREALTAAGAQVEEIELPWNMHELARAAFAHYGAIMAPMIRDSLGAEWDEAESYTHDFVEVAEQIEAEFGLFHAVQWEARVQHDLAQLFRAVDVIVCPTGMVHALPIDDDHADHVVRVDGEPVPVVHHLEAFFAMPFNMASRLPVLAVPTRYRVDGPPASVQVVGKPYDGSEAFRVAAAIEEHAGWYREGRTRPQPL